MTARGCPQGDPSWASYFRWTLSLPLGVVLVAELLVRACRKTHHHAISKQRWARTCPGDKKFDSLTCAAKRSVKYFDLRSKHWWSACAPGLLGFESLNWTLRFAGRFQETQSCGSPGVVEPGYKCTRTVFSSNGGINSKGQLERFPHQSVRYDMQVHLVQLGCGQLRLSFPDFFSLRLFWLLR